MQTRWQSFMESSSNIAIGYFTALLTQIIVFPWFGIKISISQNIKIGIIFTVVALVRGYFVRRLFNRLHR